MNQLLSISLLLLCCHCYAQSKIIVLGIAQDGGFPHIGCQEECQQVWDDPAMQRFVVSLAVLDEEAEKWWMFEATPDFVKQLQYFQEITDGKYPYLPAGIFLTHAHMGHYTGLMQLGREALGASNVAVHVLPKFANYLRTNGPWSQLVSLNNIDIMELTQGQGINVSAHIKVTPYQVPHRDEFSETAGFGIHTSVSSTLFIPDIDKWEKWNYDIVDMVKQYDRAFIDGSFYQDGELPNRSISEVPHPFVSETMDLFKDESAETKARIFFIHFNHTNPLLWNSQNLMNVIGQGFNIAVQGKTYD